jgi:hypothetical protein
MKKIDPDTTGTTECVSLAPGPDARNQSLTSFMEAKNVRLNDEVRELFDRLLSEGDDEDRVLESPERMRG